MKIMKKIICSFSFMLFAIRYLPHRKISRHHLNYLILIDYVGILISPVRRYAMRNLNHLQTEVTVRWDTIVW